MSTKGLSYYDKVFVLTITSIVCTTICLSSGWLVNYFNFVPMPFWWLWTVYLIGGTMGTTTHWLGHKHWTGKWFRAHTIEHHTKLYPSKRFLSKDLLCAKDGNAKYYLPTILFCTFISYLYLQDWRSTVFCFLWVIAWFEFAGTSYFYFTYTLSSLWKASAFDMWSE